MPPFKIPILDPLGILSEPGSRIVTDLMEEEVKLHDPIRDFILSAWGVDTNTDDTEEVETVFEILVRKTRQLQPPPQPQPRNQAPSDVQRSEYYSLGDRIVRDSFTRQRNRAVAEQVARTFAPNNPQLQLECLNNIRDFTMYPENSEQYLSAKDWLELHDLKDLLRQAYMAGFEK